MKNEIVTYLLEIGVKPHYKGFDYLTQALLLTATSKRRLPICEIYRRVGAEFDVAEERVERCIRTIIGTYFDNMDNPPKYKYTNAEFIYLCTEQIRLIKSAADQ